MLARLALLLAVAACGQPSPQQAISNQHSDPDPDPDPDPVPDPDPDPDRDRILGACDHCPTEPETWNAILDRDGCPDSSGTSHAVIEDPTNHFEGTSIEERFTPDSARLQSPPDPSFFLQAVADRGIEAIECIGQAAPGERSPARLAARRARALCDHLVARGLTVPFEVRAVGTGPIRVDPELTDGASTPRAVVQVVRAEGVQIWRWTGTHLERATPRRRLEYERPIAPECDAPR